MKRNHGLYSKCIMRQTVNTSFSHSEYVLHQNQHRHDLLTKCPASVTHRVDSLSHSVSHLSCLVAVTHRVIHYILTVSQSGRMPCHVPVSHRVIHEVTRPQCHCPVTHLVTVQSYTISRTTCSSVISLGH